MQIFFKYSFSLEGKHVLTGKKVISSKQSQFLYDFTFAYLIWKELCSLFSVFFLILSSSPVFLFTYWNHRRSYFFPFLSQATPDQDQME